jgi:tetratricopeptide (TPR) repeat protein
MRQQGYWGLAVSLAAWCSLTAAGEWFSRDFQYRRLAAIEQCAPGTPACYVSFAHFGACNKDGSDIRVVNPAGKRVAHEILNITASDVDLLFDSLGAKPDAMYAVYFGNPGAKDAPDWKAPAGVVMEVYKKAPGGYNNWNEYKKMYDASKELIGRTLRPKIFDGFNPIGPNYDFVSHYRAHFVIPAPGTYKFSTNSDEASFLFVNGAMIAQMPGRHGMWDGRFGQHGGTIDLKAGTHVMDYYHVQTDADCGMMAYWQRPGDKYMNLMDDKCFVPIGKARAKTIQRADNKQMMDFHWAPVDHLVVNGRYMIRYALESRAGPHSELNWDFGDGTTAKLDPKQSLRLHHGFINPGVYTVTLSGGPGTTFLPLKQQVTVAPVWPQREEFDDNRWKDYRTAILARIETNTLRGADLLTVITFATSLQDKDLLAAAATKAELLSKQIPPADHAQLFLTLGMQLQSQLKAYNHADRAFRDGIGGPGDEKTKARIKLHRAGLLIHVLGKPQEALSILQNIKGDGLEPPNEPVLRNIYLADAYASLGQRDEAVRRYESLRTVVPLTDRVYAAGRRGRLLSVGSFIKRGDFEAALDELRNIEWETPQERMADDTGVLRAQCYLGEKDYQSAVLVLDRLMKMNPGSPRVPEMMLLSIRASQGMNRNDLAEEMYARMKKEQPYAAETALAAALFSK